MEDNSKAFLMKEKPKDSKPKLATAATYTLDLYNLTGIQTIASEDVDKMESFDLDEYRDVVKSCRFFYQRDPIACFDPETEVLTKDGWKYFKDTTPKDLVCTLSKDNIIEYQRPTNILSYDYDGQMYFVKTTQVDLKVTPNHKMYVAERDAHHNRSSWKYKLVDARDIYKKHILFKKDGIWVGKETNNFKIGSRLIAAEDWLKLFGLWIAEGCVVKTLHSYQVDITHTNDYNIQQIISILNKLNIHSHYNGLHLRFSDKDIHTYLLPMTGALNKYIPQEYLELSPKLLNIFLDWYLRGDGYRRKDYHRVYAFTSSTILRDQLQELALKAGYGGSNYYSKKITSAYSKKLDRTITATTPNYIISFLKKVVGTKKDYTANEGFVDYSGKVYCVEVPNHIIYIRRKGKCVWSGNSTVLNKIVEIGINDLVFDRNGLSINEFRIFTNIKEKLLEFAENCALEYLISGLVVPEIKYTPTTKEELKDLGIKKYDSLILPEVMWLRDPETIKINDPMILDEPSYYVEIPGDLHFFIIHEGQYPDNTKDLDLYEKLLTLYPVFVEQVRAGVKYIPLENKLIIRRKVLSNTCYPLPYLFPSLEALKHKRNLRRMDYSLASRVITAIQLFKLGSDEFPVTESEEDQSQFNFIRDQMSWRNTAGQNTERIFQLFANHTLNIEWIMPDVQALLNEKKYSEVNQDIFFSLGFPKILTTGETERSGASDPEFATISPVKTMENLRTKILFILRGIVKEIARSNNLKTFPGTRFKPINLHSFSNFVEGMTSLYQTGNISRTSYTEAFGYNLEEELKTKSEENELMKELGVDEFPAQPFSPQPGGKAAAQPDKQEGSPRE